MTNENIIPGKVIFVDDDSTVRKSVTRAARLDGIEDLEVFEDADSAVVRLEGLEEAAAAVFSDGLNGGWRKVIDAAKKVGVPAIVVSGDPIQREVEEAGAAFISKTGLEDLGFIATTLAELQHPADI